MNFGEAVAALTARGPGRMIPDLSRITRLAELLGDPHVSYPSVHVTGTNGKTSVSRMVAALCSAVGLSAGTYTSPHLQTVRERLSVAGRMVSERAFAALYEEIAPLADVVDDQLTDARDHVTYFELLTAMAYWWFAEQAVDVGVFEVGMGGRWDATNLVRGDVAVLTRVDVDHPQLGDTPGEVAEEKVGIIKEGSRIVTASQTDDVMGRIRGAADDRAADLLVWGRDVDVSDRRLAVGGQRIALRVGDRVVDDIALPLFGAHQARNAALALGALAALTGPTFREFDEDLIRQGFLGVSVPGRLEVVDTDPTVLLDGAHNPHGASTAAEAIREAFTFRTLIAVVGCLSDKDVPGMLRAWRDLADHVVVTRAPSPRAATVEQVALRAGEVWDGTGVIVEVAEDIGVAMDKATGLAAPGDGVLVTGSLTTVGAARDLYLPVEDDGDEVIYEPGHTDGDEAEVGTLLERLLDDPDPPLDDPDRPEG